MIRELIASIALGIMFPYMPFWEFNKVSQPIFLGVLTALTTFIFLHERDSAYGR